MNQVSARFLYMLHRSGSYDLNVSVDIEVTMSILAPVRNNLHLLHILRDFQCLHSPRKGKMGKLRQVTDASDVSLVFELQSKLQKERYLYIDVRYVFLISTDSSPILNGFQKALW